MNEDKYSKTPYFWLSPRPSPLARSIFALIEKGRKDALPEVDLLIAARLKAPPKPLLIGVAATGWTFQFRGYRTKEQIRAAGLMQPVVSVSDWRRVIRRGFLFNNEAEVLSQDEFWQRVAQQAATRFEGKLPRNPTVSFQKVRNPQLRAQALSSCWLDSEGYAFCDESW